MLADVHILFERISQKPDLMPVGFGRVANLMMLTLFGASVKRYEIGIVDADQIQCCTGMGRRDSGWRWPYALLIRSSLR